MNNIDDLNLDPLEQSRADRLAQAIDQLLNGETPTFDDPLLTVVRDLQRLPFEPSAAALARFDQQVNRWFAPPTPAVPVRPVPRWLIGIAAIVIVAFTGLVLRQTAFAPPPIPTMTATPTASSTRTSTVSPSPTPTPSPTPDATATATMLPTHTSTPAAPVFTHLVISGIIQSIDGSAIVLFGQPVQVDGGVGGLCAGDFVSLQATIVPDTTLHTTRKAITVVFSACPVSGAPRVQPANPPAGNNADGSDEGDPPEHHDK